MSMTSSLSCSIQYKKHRVQLVILSSTCKPQLIPNATTLQKPICNFKFKWHCRCKCACSCFGSALGLWQYCVFQWCAIISLFLCTGLICCTDQSACLCTWMPIPSPTSQNSSHCCPPASAPTPTYSQPLKNTIKNIPREHMIPSTNSHVWL